MSNNSKYFLSKALGEDFLESLAKTDIWKPDTKTVSNLEDMKVGLKIVPRTLMSLLISELSKMKTGESKDIDLPLPNEARIHVNKHERDQYSGEVFENNEKLTEFKFRSIPGIGLVLMSTFELYSMEEELKKPEPANIDHEKIQKFIDERLALHRMIEQVVEGKLRHRDAVQEMLLGKLTEAVHAEPMGETMSVKKQSPLKAFLENKKKKNEFVVEMAKGETANCGDCGKSIFDGNAFSSCICYGDDFQRKIFMKKTQDGIKVRFSKGWDMDNISMLLETLRNRK